MVQEKVSRQPGRHPAANGIQSPRQWHAQRRQVHVNKLIEIPRERRQQGQKSRQNRGRGRHYALDERVDPDRRGARPTLSDRYPGNWPAGATQRRQQDDSAVAVRMHQTGRHRPDNRG